MKVMLLLDGFFIFFRSASGALMAVGWLLSDLSARAITKSIFATLIGVIGLCEPMPLPEPNLRLRSGPGI